MHCLCCHLYQLGVDAQLMMPFVSKQWRLAEVYGVIARMPHADINVYSKSRRAHLMECLGCGEIAQVIARKRLVAGRVRAGHVAQQLFEVHRQNLCLSKRL